MRNLGVVDGLVMLISIFFLDFNVFIYSLFVLEGMVVIVDRFGICVVMLSVFGMLL